MINGLFTFFGLGVLAFLAEVIDSSLGMLYSTIMSPVLIIAGVPPLLAVPAVLASQALGGFIASRTHKKLEIIDFSFRFRDPKVLFKKIIRFGFFGAIIRGISRNIKVQVLLVGLGMASTVLAAAVAVNVSPLFLKTYIGITILVLGILVLTRAKYYFSWPWMFFIGLIGAFNTGLTGAGFGVMITGGQIVSGRKVKESIATTVSAEFPIALTGFLSYWFLNGIRDWGLVGVVCLGNALGAKAGAGLLSKIRPQKLKKTLGVIIVLLGLLTLTKTLMDVKGVELLFPAT